MVLRNLLRVLVMSVESAKDCSHFHVFSCVLSRNIRKICHKLQNAKKYLALNFTWSNESQFISLVHWVILLFRIFKTLYIPNRKSWGAEIFRECSPPTMCHMSRVRSQGSSFLGNWSLATTFQYQEYGLVYVMMNI